MASGGTGSNSLANNATTTATTAGQESEAQKAFREHNQAWLDWGGGKDGPVDIRNAPDQIGMAFGKDAKMAHDAHRIGKGYGSLADGGNPAFSAALDKEEGLQRDEMGGAALEDWVGGQYNQANQNLFGLAGMENQQNQFSASLAQQALQNSYNKPPSFGKQLALGAISALKFAPIH